MVDTVTLLLSLGTIGLQVLLLVGVILFFTKKGNHVLSWVGKRGVFFAYALALAGMVGSLYYSEVAKFAPCVLCWYQRIFVYANVFILGLAVYQKEKAVIPYASLLSIIGGIVALYHVCLPLLPAASATCSLVSDVSCTESYFTMFGYITIPVISLTSFVAMWLLLQLANKHVR